jgi:hypothetical protein
MDVNVVFLIWKLALAKNQQEGYGTRENFYLTINQAQRDYLDYLMGEYQTYQATRPIAVVQFGQNERIRQSLAPLIYGAILNVDPNTGIGQFPSDYEYVDNMWGQYGYYNIKFIQQNRLDSVVHSVIDPIAQNPVFIIQHEGFHFFPQTIGLTTLSYIRTPPSIVWGFSLDSNGREVYDPSTSQDPIWAETDIIEIIGRALKIQGVSLQVGSVIQYANDVTSKLQ